LEQQTKASGEGRRSKKRKEAETITNSIIRSDTHLPLIHRIDDGPHTADEVGEDELAVVWKDRRRKNE